MAKLLPADGAAGFFAGYEAWIARVAEVCAGLTSSWWEASWTGRFNVRPTGGA